MITVGEKLKYSDRNLSQPHSLHYPSHTDCHGMKPRPL